MEMSSADNSDGKRPYGSVCCVIGMTKATRKASDKQNSDTVRVAIGERL